MLRPPPLCSPPAPQVEFSPSLQTLAGVVNDIGSHLFSTISVFRHLPEILIRRKFQRDPIHVIVGEWTVGRAQGRQGLGGQGWAGPAGEARAASRHVGPGNPGWGSDWGRWRGRRAGLGGRKLGD